MSRIVRHQNLAGVIFRHFKAELEAAGHPGGLSESSLDSYRREAPLLLPCDELRVVQWWETSGRAIMQRRQARAYQEDYCI